MARMYHVDIARHAARASAKWIDNVLSRFSLPGVIGGTQGVARRLDVEAIYQIALASQLTEALSLPVAAALSLSRLLLDAESLKPVPVIDALTFRFDRARFTAEIDRRIADAVESVAPRRRGRPPAVR